MSKNFSQKLQKVLNPSMKGQNVNQKIVMDFDYSPIRKKSKVRSPICINDSLIYKTPPNNNQVQKKYSPCSMVNELTDKKSNSSSQTCKNDQKAITKYSPMIIEKPEQESSSQKKRKSNNGIMQNLISTNLEQQQQYTQFVKVSDNIFGVQQISRIDQQQYFMNYPKNNQAGYQTPKQNSADKQKYNLTERSSQKIKIQDDIYIMSDERVDAFLNKNQNNILYSPFYSSNQNLYDQPIQYSLIKLQSDSNKLINAQSQAQLQNVNISNFNKQKVQKFIFNNNQTFNESYQQDPTYQHKNKEYDQKQSFCYDNIQCARLNSQQVNQEGQVKQNKNNQNSNENNQRKQLQQHQIQKNFTIKKEGNYLNEGLQNDKIKTEQDNIHFKDLLKMEKKSSGESIEIENQNVAERLFQKFENVKIQGNEKAEIMPNKNEIIKSCVEKQQLYRDNCFQRLIDELEDIQSDQQELVNLINQSTCQIDNINSQIYQDLNQSFESYISDQGCKDKDKKRQIYTKQHHNNQSVINQFCENVNNITEIKSKFSIQSTKIPQNSLHNSLIGINTQLAEIQNKQQIQENAIYQFFKQIQKHNNESSGLIEQQLQFSPLQGATQKLEQIQKKQFQCKFCNKTFNKSCSLGGHISRVHKGKSDQYKEKQKIREKRQMERQRKTYFKQKGQLSQPEENSMHSIQSLDNNKIKKKIKVTEKKQNDSTQMEEESQAQEINKENSNSKNQINESLYILEEDDFESNNIKQFHDQSFGQLEEEEDEEDYFDVYDGKVIEDQSNIITKKICKDKKKNFVPINKKNNNTGKYNKSFVNNKQYLNNL
ncbi:hypothetical protein ABPG74_021456 [Tetrahymena malaccensis]